MGCMIELRRVHHSVVLLSGDHEVHLLHQRMGCTSEVHRLHGLSTNGLSKPGILTRNMAYKTAAMPSSIRASPSMTVVSSSLACTCVLKWSQE